MAYYGRVTDMEGFPRSSRKGGAAGGKCPAGPAQNLKEENTPARARVWVGMLRRARIGLLAILGLLALRNHLYERMTHDFIFRKVYLRHHRVVDQKM